MNERRFPAPAPSRTPPRLLEPGDDNSRKNQKKQSAATSKQPVCDRPARDGKDPGRARDNFRGPRRGGNKSFRPGGYEQPDASAAERKFPPAKTAQERDKEQHALQPGLKPVLELLETDPSRVDAVFLRKGRKGKETDRILDLCRSAGVRFFLADDAFLARLWPGNHQGAIARLYAAGFTNMETAMEMAAASPLPLLLAFDQVQDPGNAGAMARTLYALGGAGIIVPRHNGVYLGAAAAKASAGALEHLAVVKAVNLGQALDAAEKAGFVIYGASSSPVDGVPMTDTFAFRLDFPAVLVLGNEEGGLRPTIAKRCRALLRIPLARAFDSLNVAQAGAILMAGFAAAHNS